MTLIDKTEAHDDDLIRRGDARAAVQAAYDDSGFEPDLADADARIAALPARGVGVKPDRATFDAMCAMRNSINEHIPMPSLESDLLQGPENSVFCATVAEAVIAEVSRLRGIISGTVFKQLEWHNFDAWTHWAEGACGTYHVEERNGYWQVELRVGGLVHGVTDTGDTTPEDLEAAKAAAQADYEARIRAALASTDYTLAPHLQKIVDGAKTAPQWDMQADRLAPTDAPDTDLLFDAYKGMLVLHRTLDRMGLARGSATASRIADKIVAAHPEFPARTALRHTEEPK